MYAKIKLSNPNLGLYSFLGIKNITSYLCNEVWMQDINKTVFQTPT